MRGTLAAVILIALCAVLAWASGVFDSGGAAPAAPGTPEATPGAGRAPPEQVAERSELPPAGEPAGPTSPEPAPVADPDDTGSIVELLVVDRASGSPLRGFSFVLDGPDGSHLDRAVVGDSVELPIAPEQSFSLRVEAVGYMPSDPQAIRLAPAERRRQLRVELEPAQRATGVTFEVRGPDLDPVTALRVRALRRPLDAAADTPFERVWERSSRSADGSYRLPDLAPGSYRFELQAVDEDGRPAALVPVERDVQYYGAQQITDPVELGVGALLSLAVHDAAGRPLGPEVALRLEDADGKPLRTRWRFRSDGEVLEGVDVLPGAGRCELDVALRPGFYTLRLQRGGGTPIDRPLRLEAGRRHDLEVRIE